MALLGKDFQPPPMATADVELPEFGGSMRIRQWTGETREELFAVLRKHGDDTRWNRAAAVAVSAVDESGERLFDSNGDVERIQATWPASAIERLWSSIATLNYVGEKGVKAAEKN
jgi:hypothetical protein